MRHIGKARKFHALTVVNEGNSPNSYDFNVNTATMSRCTPFSILRNTAAI